MASYRLLFSHSMYEMRACTQQIMFGIALSPAFVPLLDPSPPSAARHARACLERIDEARDCKLHITQPENCT